ncbi:MAG: cyclase [Thermoleophilia bacterium]
MRTVLIVRHRVADYDAWKAVYDTVGDIQRDGGVMDHAVMTDPADPGMVVVVHTFASPEAAGAFLQRDDLREAMGRGGVDPETFRAEVLQEVVAGRI